MRSRREASSSVGDGQEQWRSRRAARRGKNHLNREGDGGCSREQQKLGGPWGWQQGEPELPGDRKEPPESRRGWRMLPGPAEAGWPPEVAAEGNGSWWPYRGRLASRSAKLGHSKDVPGEACHKSRLVCLHGIMKAWVRGTSIKSSVDWSQEQASRPVLGCTRAWGTCDLGGRESPTMTSFKADSHRSQKGWLLQI